MQLVEKSIGSMLGLILLYLIIKNASAFNNIISSISANVNNQITALQGR